MSTVQFRRFTAVQQRLNLVETNLFLHDVSCAWKKDVNVVAIGAMVLGNEKIQPSFCMPASTLNAPNDFSSSLNFSISWYKSITPETNEPKSPGSLKANSDGWTFRKKMTLKSECHFLIWWFPATGFKWLSIAWWAHFHSTFEDHWDEAIQQKETLTHGESQHRYGMQSHF